MSFDPILAPAPPDEMAVAGKRLYTAIKLARELHPRCPHFTYMGYATPTHTFECRAHEPAPVILVTDAQIDPLITG